MWHESSPFNRNRKRNIRDYKEYTERVEMILSGKPKICSKDIDNQLFELWEAGLISDKNGKYKDMKTGKTKSTETTEPESEETDSESELSGFNMLFE